MIKKIHYLNLTNGLEHYPKLKDNCRFIRIQSTVCEQKDYNRLIMDLDNDLLMNLAIGNECLIHDAGKNTNTRALWQGCEFIKFALNKIWLGIDYKPKGRSESSMQFFINQLYDLSKSASNKLKYYRKFLMIDKINLHTHGIKTNNDGNYKYYSEMLRKT